LGVVENKPIQVALVDQRIAVMPGVELLRKVLHTKPEVIRLLFGGYADIKPLMDALRQGVAYRYILTPWDTEELKTIVDQAFDQYDLITDRDRLKREVVASGPVGTGTSLGPYRLLEKLGEGGMGTVFRAVHTLLNREVALKVLLPERVNDPKAVARFLREIRAMGCLNHPNIVQFFEAGEVSGRHFLVMEFVEGVNLADLITREGRLSIADACESVRQAARGMQHAYEHGLVHRDLKPSNLMLTPAGVVKVLDLGLARLSEDTITEELTSTGQVLGTVAYMAPEQGFARDAVTIRADIYSLGCTLYKLLTGRAPFFGSAYDSPAKILLAHAHDPVPPIGQLRPDVPAEIAALLNRALAKAPASRFDTPAHLESALQPFVGTANLPQLLPRQDSSTVDYVASSS
jgi:serine/threonine protein kinase